MHSACSQVSDTSVGEVDNKQVNRKYISGRNKAYVVKQDRKEMEKEGAKILL